VSPASTLTGAVRATFTESVANVVPADIALRVSGTTTNLATTLTCRDTAGTTVSCATGAVRAVTLQPRSALISGQRYATVFDQSTPRVTDLAGNVLVAPAATPTFRASLSEQESSAGATQLWRLVTTTAASGGSYLAERASGAALRYPFSGTSITWYTATGPTQGLAYVYVDGTRRASVNNYASTAHWKVARTVTGLAAGAHRLTIVVRGLRGSTAGKDTLVVVDAFRVGTTTTSTPYVTPLWSRVTSGSASAGAFVRSNLAASAVRFTFRGTAVSWYTVTGRDQGKAEIWVDGVRKATVDNYATATAYGVRRFVGSLTDQVHVVKVVVLGTHRTGATNSWVAVDRFGVA
jgi:hypothetical protein